MASEWKPLADGKYTHDSIIDGRITMQIEDDGEDITIFGPEEMYEFLSLSPFKYRLCYRVAVPAAPAVPPDIAETMREALEYYLTRWGTTVATGKGFEFTPNEMHKARIDAVLAWLAAQKGEETTSGNP